MVKTNKIHMYRYKSNNINCPNVEFTNNKLCIVGESYMEDPYEFYLPIMNEIREYFNNNKNIIVDLKISYINTASMKCLREIFNFISKNIKENQINIYYDKYDTDYIDDIDNMTHDLDMNINKIELV